MHKMIRPAHITWLLIVAFIMIIACTAHSSAIKSTGISIKGPNYSACLSDGRFEYYPKAASSPGLVYTLKSIKLGSESITFRQMPEVKASDNAVCYYYGDIISESYTALQNGVEQCWVINARPRTSGSIVIEGLLQSPYNTTFSSGGCSFQDECGRAVIYYSPVTVIDNRGKKCQSQPEIHNNRLIIRIPKDYVESAEFPILVDPLVGPEAKVGPAYSAALKMQENVEIAASPNGYLVVWQDTRGTNGMDIFGCRLSAAGEVLDTEAISISTAAGDQTDPAVSWNGQQYLVVWTDKRNGANHIYGSRVRTDGEVLDKQGLSLSGTAGIQVYPRVASDGSCWVAVWQHGTADIYGCRITNDGAISRTNGIAVQSNIIEETPDIAWNGSYYLVVWCDYTNLEATNTDIYGCKVARTGTRMPGSGFTVSCALDGTTGIPGVQSNPRVCSYGLGCFVAWTDYRNETQPVTSDVYGTRVSSSFVVLNRNSIAISTAAGDQEFPCVGYDGSKLLVAWRNSSGRIVRGARLNTSGSVLDANGINISAGAAGATGISIAGVNNKFLLGWASLNIINSDAVTTFVNDNGTVPNTAGTVVSMGLEDQPEYSVADNGTDYVVARSQMVNGTYDIVVAKVSRSGQNLTPSPINFTSNYGGDQTQPSIAFNGTQYLLVWRDGGAAFGTGDIKGLRLNTDLAPVGASFVICAAILEGAQPTEQARPAVASNRSNFLVVWQDHRNGGSPDYPSDIFGAVVSSSGSITANPVVSMGSRSQFNPRVASDGANYYVVWEDNRNGSAPVYNNDIYGARVTSSGTVLDVAGVAIPSASYAQQYRYTPDICFGGGNYFITWTESYKIVGTRVSTGGSVLNTSGIVIDSGSTVKLNPSTYWDGTKYQTVWEDYRSTYAGNADIYHTSISQTGVVSTDPKTALVSDLYPQYRPRIFATGTAGLLLYQRYYNYSHCVCAASLLEQATQQCESISRGKQLGSGASVTLTGRIVTASFPDCIYIQDPNRISGIKVVGVSVAKDEIVNVTGTITISDGERQINATSLTIVGNSIDPPRPLGLRGDALGGANLNSYTPGVTGATGPNNIGLYVTTWGKVVDTATSGCFSIEIKPGVRVKVKSGTLTRPAMNALVQVTGISTCEVISGGTVRVIRPRQQTDIKTLQ